MPYFLGVFHVALGEMGVPLDSHETLLPATQLGKGTAAGGVECNHCRSQEPCGDSRAAGGN